MSKLPEISDLFARLATNLETLDKNEDETHDLLISKLNQSLNLSEPRVRVLDTALSLMCFTGSQVFDSLTEYLVKTVVAVLSSTINCKVLSFQTESVLQIGSSISSSDCGEVIDACADVLGELKGYGTLSSSLLYAVVKMAVSSSCYRYVLNSTPILDAKSINTLGPSLHKLLHRLPKEVLKSQEIPLRLLFWYLNPVILKDDVSQILREVTTRPFLCLTAEFYERLEWRSIIICLAVSPLMFIETRALLHNWFLAVGLTSILKLQSELTTAVLDVISRPMWWGLCAELGSKLPCSYAYFPYNHKFLKTLSGPLSRDGFLCLIDSINKSVSQAKIYSGPVGHKSMWAMAMNFTDWFYYASVLLFSRSFHFNCVFGPIGDEQYAAAKFMAWILDPISESDHSSLADSLSKISSSFPLKQFNPDKNNKPTGAYKKKLKKTKISYDRSNDCDVIQLWIRDFQSMYIKHFKKSHEKNTLNGFSIKNDVLFRSIPLGILIGFCENIDEEVSELLLHYSATGSTILTSCNEKEYLEGARIVFDVTDMAERMADSIFETEDNQVDFICKVKLRAGNYMIKCLINLLDLRIGKGDGYVMLSDLHNRVVRWKAQGKDIFVGNKELDNAIYAMKSKLS